MTLVEILAPVIGTITIIAMAFVLGAIIHTFLSKTRMGAHFKNATPWMGWYDETDENFTNFTIHPANYRKVPSAR